jgi:hypothetical protein
MGRLFDVQSRFPGWQATIEHARVCVTERAEHEESSRRGEYPMGVIPGAEVSSNVGATRVGLELQDDGGSPRDPGPF